MTLVATPPDPGIAGLLRQLALGVACTLYLGLFLFGHVIVAGPEEATQGAGSTINQLMLIGAFGAALFAAAPWLDPRKLLLPVTLMMAVGWCWLSVTWAIEPSISMRRVFRLTLQVFTAFLIVRELGYERTVQMLRVAFAITLLACYVVIFAVPDIGIQQQYSMTEPDAIGRWRGVFVDKNSCGAFTALTILLFTFDARRVPIWARIAVILGAALLLYQCNSKTSMGIVAVSLAAGAALNQYNPLYRVLLIPGGMIAGVVAYFLIGDIAQPFQAALYDTSILTGRGPIWATLIAFIRDHPLLGAGFGSFWQIGASSPVFIYADADWVRTNVPIGHNGYLDIWAAVGLPGLILGVVATIVAPFVKLLTGPYRRSSQIALFAGILLFYVGNNLTESSLLNVDAVLNIAVMLTLAMIAVTDRQPVVFARPRTRTAPPVLKPAAPPR